MRVCNPCHHQNVQQFIPSSPKTVFQQRPHPTRNPGNHWDAFTPRQFCLFQTGESMKFCSSSPLQRPLSCRMKVFEMHPGGCLHQYCSLFFSYPSVVFHYWRIAHFVYPFIHGRMAGSSKARGVWLSFLWDDHRSSLPQGKAIGVGFLGRRVGICFMYRTLACRTVLGCLYPTYREWGLEFSMSPSALASAGLPNDTFSQRCVVASICIFLQNISSSCMLSDARTQGLSCS